MTQQSDAIRSNARPEKDLGIELIRIIAMLLIVCQHFMNHGGFLKNAGENEFFLNLLHVLFAPAVNVFVLITGYFGVNTRGLKIKKGAELWLQVLFYSLAMLPIAYALGASISNEYVYASFAPIIHRYYWFFSAYFILFLTIPFLSAMLNGITQKQHLALICGIFVCAYLSSRFDINKVLSFAGGYSIIWFMMLFCIGGYLRKYPIKVKRIYLIALYMFTVVIHMVFRYYLNDTSKLVEKLVYCSTDYTEPLTLLAAVCLFLIFRGIKSNGTILHRFICYIGSCSFGVYLFHETPKIRSVLYTKVFNTPKFWGHPQAALIVIGFAILTFTAGCVIETFRKQLFTIIKLIIARIKKETNQAED